MGKDMVWFETVLKNRKKYIFKFILRETANIHLRNAFLSRSKSELSVPFSPLPLYSVIWAVFRGNWVVGVVAAF